MKKTLKLAGALLCAILVLGIGSGRVFARLAGTNPGTDIWCMGPSGAEVCVDTSGNLLPTTDDDTTLGTSALRWATAFIMDITVGDDLTVTDAMTVGGQTQLYTRTSTQIGALTPAGSGYMLINITTAGLCISTGTGAGAWVYVSTTATPSSEAVCY